MELADFQTLSYLFNTKMVEISKEIVIFALKT